MEGHPPQTTDYKRVVRDLLTELAVSPTAVVMLADGSPPDDGSLCLLHERPEPLTVGWFPGARGVRGWLWGARRARAMSRVNTVLWAVGPHQMDGHPVYTVGVGSIVPPHAVETARRLFGDRCLEVGEDI